MTLAFPGLWSLQPPGVLKARGLGWHKEFVCLVAMLSFLAGREDGERSESPPSARARAADHVEGEVQFGKQQSAD